MESNEVSRPEESAASPDLAIQTIPIVVVARLIRHAHALGLDTNDLEKLVAGDHIEDDAEPSCERKIRTLTTAGVPFAAVAPWFWRAFESQPTAELAVKMLEYAWFKGTPAEQVATIQSFLDWQLRFYHLVKPRVRCGLLLAISFHRPALTITLLNQLPNEALFEPVEHLMYLVCLHRNLVGGDMYEYYIRYQSVVDEAVAQLQGGDKAPLSGLYYDLALASLHKYDTLQTTHCLAKIAPEGIWQEKALDLQKKLEDVSTIGVEASLLSQITEQKDWRARLATLRGFIEVVEQKSDSYSQSHLVMVNDLLADPLSLMPVNPITLNELAHLLASHLTLHDLLPNIKNLFLDRAKLFDGRRHETAFWSPLLEQRGASPLMLYLRGIALFHLTVAADRFDEEALCTSYDLIQKNNSLIGSAAVLWTEMVKEFLKEGRIEQSGDRLIATKLLVLSGWHHVDEKQQLSLVEKEQTSTKFLARLIRLVPHGAEGQRFKKKLCASNPLALRTSNSELDDIWLNACKAQDFDLAWRAASVALARNVLQPNIFQIWSLFGEKKPMTDQWPSFGIAMALVALEHKSPEVRQFMDDLVALRPVLLPLLLGEMGEPPRESLLWRFPGIKASLDAIGWLKIGKLGMAPDQVLAPLEGRVFSMSVTEIAGRLGISAFKWDGGLLRKVILPFSNESSAGITLFADRSIATQLRCDAEQQGRLARVTRTLGALAPNELYGTLISFVTRLAVTVGGDHFGALADLQKMAVDLGVINQLENWILSDAYSRIRKEMRIVNRHLVPVGLRGEKLVGNNAESNQFCPPLNQPF